MREQIKYVFQIGYPKAHKGFEQSIVAQASKMCGGCTTDHKNGWWTEDGASHGDTFKGALMGEHCFQLELTTEKHKASRVLKAMQTVIADAALWWGIDTDWVHVSETEMVGHHFSVKAINERNAA